MFHMNDLFRKERERIKYLNFSPSISLQMINKKILSQHAARCTIMYSLTETATPVINLYVSFRTSFTRYVELSLGDCPGNA